MEKPVLVVMAAGMGSRYGGLKQIEPVGPNGELIMDYSVYDAVKAGFGRLICVIKRGMEDDFDGLAGARAGRLLETAYAFQSVDSLPEGFRAPEGREKPWGTAHAVLSARELIGDSPFLVINSDDYYGPSAFKTAFDWLVAPGGGAGKRRYGMVGYLAENTLTEHGAVTRGVCETDAAGMLARITERAGVERNPGGGARFPSEDGSWTEIGGDAVVSMNCWCLSPEFLESAANGFPRFLEENIPINPQKCEYLLPSVIDAQIRRGEAEVEVLKSGDRWHGVTYKEDKAGVCAAMREKHAAGIYPTPLWAGI
jgi:hypothetical protein